MSKKPIYVAHDQSLVARIAARGATNPDSIDSNYLAFGKAIADLAQKSGETIWFHENINCPAKPAILFECSKSLLAKIRELPTCLTAYKIVRDMVPTKRSPELQSLFSAPHSPAVPSLKTPQKTRKLTP